MNTTLRSKSTAQRPFSNKDHTYYTAVKALPKCQDTLGSSQLVRTQHPLPGEPGGEGRGCMSWCRAEPTTEVHTLEGFQARSGDRSQSPHCQAGKCRTEQTWGD